MLAAARAKAKAKMAAPTPSEGVRRPAGIHYARLKAYAADLRKEGLPQLAHHLVAHPGELPEVMDQLNEETRIQDSEPSEDILESNRKVFTQGTTKIELLKMTKDFCAEELVGRCTERGVCHITNGLTAYCNIIDMVTPVNESTAFSLKFDQYSILGGWADPSNYDVCRLPAGASFEREEQNRVVFALGKGSSVEKFVAAAQLQIFTGKIADTLDNIYGTKNTPHKVAEMHVCFGFSAYVNYGYHKDALDLKSEVDLTFMLMLSPGRSSMRVAGAPKESFYEYPGDMLYFDAVDVYHRSGLACARTLKIAFFVKLTGSAPVPIDSGGDGGGSSSSTKMDKQVKQELVKKEPKVEGELKGEEEEPAAAVQTPQKNKSCPWSSSFSLRPPLRSRAVLLPPLLLPRIKTRPRRMTTRPCCCHGWRRPRSWRRRRLRRWRKKNTSPRATRLLPRPLARLWSVPPPPPRAPPRMSRPLWTPFLRNPRPSARLFRRRRRRRRRRCRRRRTRKRTRIRIPPTMSL